MSLAVVGADHPNKRPKDPTRRFEIAICEPGEPIELRPEPTNPADPRAIAVYSARDVQLGYIRAEQAQWIGGRLAIMRAIFHHAAAFGAVIRVTFDGSEPALPVQRALGAEDHSSSSEDDWPPADPADEFGSI